MFREAVQRPLERAREPIREAGRLWPQIDVNHMRLALRGIAAVLLIASIFLPYWAITLHAPQYPYGLNIEVYVYKLTGDVREVDGLNHYIGMMPLEEAAQLERKVAPFAIPAVALLAVVSLWMRGRWKWLLLLPVVAYPIVFFIDLTAWLYYAGHTLDPTAALSGAIDPFMPQVLGTGYIGQFSTVASFGSGFYLAALAAILALIAIFLDRRTNHESDWQRDRPHSESLSLRAEHRDSDHGAGHRRADHRLSADDSRGSRVQHDHRVC
jgi:copper chaperone NosL